MIETRGRILSIADGMAEVRIAAVSACGSCRSRSSCGTGDSRVVRVEAGAAMHEGDEVALQLEESALVSGALLGYLMPALTLLGGALLATAFHGSDAAAAIGAGAGLAAGLIGLRFAAGGKRQPAACHPLPRPSQGDTP